MDKQENSKTKYEYAVVHGGAAHPDDELCIKLTFALNLAPVVYRRDPTRAELDNPAVLVMDVGGEHDPDKGNFDHHQLSTDTPDCAAWMLCNHLGIHAKMLRMYPWYGVLGVIDSKGLVVAARDAGVPPAAVAAFCGQDHDLLLSLLRDTHGDDPLLPDSLLGHFLTVAGKRIVDRIAQFDALEAVVDSELLVPKIGGLFGFDARPLHGKIPAADLTSFLAIKRDELIASLGEGSAGIPAWSMSLDESRGPLGIVLYRYANDKRIDFRKALGMPGVLFVHGNGFLARLAPDADVHAIVGASIDLTAGTNATNATNGKNDTNDK